MSVVGAEDDKKMAKTPFTLFDEIRSMGVKTVWANPDEVSTKHAGAKFDVVVDNNGKDMDTVRSGRRLCRRRAARPNSCSCPARASTSRPRARRTSKVTQSRKRAATPWSKRT